MIVSISFPFMYSFFSFAGNKRTTTSKARGTPYTVSCVAILPLYYRVVIIVLPLYYPTNGAPAVRGARARPDVLCR